MEYGEGLGWGTVAISEPAEDLSQYLAIHIIFALLKEVLLDFPTQARSPGMEQVDSPTPEGHEFIASQMWKEN